MVEGRLKFLVGGVLLTAGSRLEGSESKGWAYQQRSKHRNLYELQRIVVFQLQIFKFSKASQSVTRSSLLQLWT